MHKYTLQQHIKAFWEKVIISNDIDKCWIWSAYIDRKTGYGYKQWFGVPTLVHRVSWILSHGEIPDGLFVLHKCDNKICVNPNHLFLGTQLDNMQDMIAKGRKIVSNGERNGSAKLTRKQVDEIRQWYAQGGATQKEIAVKFGVQRTVVSRIVNKILWKDN